MHATKLDVQEDKVILELQDQPRYASCPVCGAKDYECSCPADTPAPKKKRYPSQQYVRKMKRFAKREGKILEPDGTAIVRFIIGQGYPRASIYLNGGLSKAQTDHAFHGWKIRPHWTIGQRTLELYEEAKNGHSADAESLCGQEAIGTLSSETRDQSESEARSSQQRQDRGSQATL